MNILQQLKRDVGASLRTLVTVVAVLVVAVPAAAWAGHHFTDVGHHHRSLLGRIVLL